MYVRLSSKMATKCKHGKVSRGANKGKCRKSKKTPSKRSPKAAKASKPASIPARARCYYVAKMGSAAAAKKMVGSLKKDGYLAYSVKGSSVADGHSIFSCGKK